MSDNDILDSYSWKELRHALKRADPELLEVVLRFLEEDPYTSGAGYSKEIIWKYIKRYELQPSHLERLERVALKYLEYPMSREYKLMCQTMSRLGSPGFWQAVQAHLDSDNSIVALNAYCLFPYSQGIYSGEKQRLYLRTLTTHLRWGSGNWYKKPPSFTFDDLLVLVEDEANWKEGHLVRKITDDAYIASRYYDESFTSIDWSQCIPQVLIPLLGQALRQCQSDFWTEKTAIYIAYAMGRIGHPLAVPFLIDFLEQKVDYKFQSSTVETYRTAIFRALNQIGTPEALEAVDKRPNPYGRSYDRKTD